MDIGMLIDQLFCFADDASELNLVFEIKEALIPKDQETILDNIEGDFSWQLSKTEKYNTVEFPKTSPSENRNHLKTVANFVGWEWFPI